MMNWRLASGADRRFRSGHPWVYSNELSESPKGLEAGAPVELCDASGKFLARGYGNPGSLIAFRSLSRDPKESEPLSLAGIRRRLERARSLRSSAGLLKASHRWCFGEADGLPGLIVDFYLVEAAGGLAPVAVVQAHTAGMNRVLDHVVGSIEAMEPRAAIVIRNDLAVRKLEGLAEEEPRVHRNPESLGLSNARIRLASASDAGLVAFETDLERGQKTGFFLDQAANIRLVCGTLLPGLRPRDGKRLKILDLCCYVGQWGGQLARAAKALGWEAEVLAVDASAGALELARRNVESQGGICRTLKGDILEDLAGVEPGFDLVISDPPALIKGRKNIPAGTHAYLTLHTQVFRLVREGGAIACFSCSALLEEEEFLRTLSKAAHRNFPAEGSPRVRWIGRGSQAPDHPVLAEFPEGRYLKAWLGQTE